MDVNQTNQVISWLEEEHRRDRSLLTELRQKVESQSVELNNHAKRIQDLEGRLAATHSRLTRFDTLEKAIQQAKDELVQMVRDQEETLSRYQREQTQRRQVEQESASRALNEFKRSLEAIPPLQERLAILKAEDLRLSEVVLTLQTRVTAHERQTSQLPDRITYAEGQRAQDVKAVARLQEEVVELLRRTEALSGKHQLVEDIARKNEQRMSTLATLREELTKRQNEIVEDLRLKEAQRDRVMQDWHGEVVRFEEEMAKQRKRFEQFSRQLEDAQQHLVAIDEYKTLLNREQKQVSELQRMAEDRQRRELAEWMAAEEQRWTKFNLEREATWNQQRARNEVATTKIKVLEGWREEDVERTQRLARELITIQEEYRSKLRELWVVHERAAIFQLDQVRRWYDEITTIKAEKTGEQE